MKTKLFSLGSRCFYSFRNTALLFILMVGSLFFSDHAFAQITLVTGSPQSANTTGVTLTITKPSGLAVGDVMFASIVQSDDDNSTLPDATRTGWTRVHGTEVGSTGSNSWRGTLLYKIADATDVSAANFGFTVSNFATEGSQGAVIAFRGADITGGFNEAGTANSGPFDVDPGSITQNGSVGSFSYTGFNTNTVNTGLVMFAYVGDNVNLSSWQVATGPLTLSEIFDLPLNTGLDNGLGGAWATKSAAGATGNGSVNLSANARGGVILIALRQFTSITTGAVSGPICSGSTISVPYTITGTFASNNTFTAQLSDASGSFASPTTIGTLANTNTAGSISATIPVGTAAGTGYRIRVVANQSPKNGSNNGSDLTIVPASTAVAGSNFSTCVSAGAVNITTGSSASNYSSVQWTTNGLGTIANANSMTLATYTPSVSDPTSVTLTLTAFGNSPCSNAVSNKTLTVAQVPTASAGGSATICSNQTATVSGATSSPAGATISWSENGAGSITAGGSTLTPTYTPAPGDAGNTVTLTMTVSNSPCTAATATYTVHVVGAATAVAGSTFSACSASGAVNITTGSSASNYTSIQWTTNGLGTIDNADSLTDATYTPSLSDPASVTITLTAFGNSPCGNTVSNKTLNISHQPTASAGGSATICQNQTATVSGASSSNGTISWTENGAGTITSGANTLTPTYTAAAGDAGNTVTLTMTVTNNPCTPATATYTVNVTAAATANAGTAISTCANSGAVNITDGASATQNTGVQWTSSGTGTFTDDNSLTLAMYTPSAADILAGSVTLTLTSFGNSPCGNVTANKTLTIRPIPVATGVVICTGDSGSFTSSYSCTEQSPVTSAATFASTGSNSGSGTAWTTPENVVSNNNSNASVAGNGAGFSQALRATNYGFSLPANAVIKGIQVTIGRFRSGGITGEIRDNSLQLVKAGNSVGTNKAATGTNWPTSEGVASYGATSDMWGSTWTPSEINAANFGVALIVTNTNNFAIAGTRTANVDYMQVSVTYALPGDLNWYTQSSGGSAIGTGSSFNPVGVAGSGLADTNTPGTTTYYVECSTVTGCRTPVDFVINARPEVSFTGLAADYCAGSSAVTLTANHSGGTFTGNGITDNGNGTASFNPAAVALGAHNITYSYTDGNNCPNSVMLSTTILPNATYYADADSDTYGDAASPLTTCYGAPAGYVTNNTDCNDADGTMHASFSFYPDVDLDGFGTGSLTVVCAVDANTPPSGYSLNNTDCNDADGTIHEEFQFFVDADGDGFGSGTIESVCAVDANTPPTGYSLDGTDCNDADSAIHAEFSFYVDADTDTYGTGSLMSVCAVDANTPPSGYSLNNTDCNDSVAAINPGHAEVLYNGLDDNCDGNLDEGFQLLSQVLPSQCGTTLTTISSVIGCVSFGQVITGYRFKVVNMTTLAEQTIDRTAPHFQLTSLAAYDYATTYSISVQLQRNGVWLGYYGTSCMVSSPAVLDPGGSAQVSPSQCGITLPSISTLIATTSLPGVTAYRFRVTNMFTNTQQVIDRNYHWFSLTMLNEYTYGTTYMVEVAVKTNGVFSGFGSPCQVSSPAIPQLAQCDTVISSVGFHISTTSLNRATSYRFEVTDMNTFQVNTIDRTQNWFTFNMVSSYTPAGQMAVRVAVMTSGVWSDFGEACLITAPGAARSIKTDEVAGIAFRAVSYPNPYIETFSLDVDLPTEESVDVKVYDMLGKLVETRTFEAIDTEIQTFGSKLAAGVYNVVVTQGANVKTLRVIKR
ncbi:T9SS type A sorting domain-containing protein [Flavobacterium sp. MAH-1]|uniref:T9SS type A sorting domain-containing protein n=1 Tax=Flavobacterium agri TaxID=2743471 RepID=A0A7Y8Y6K6_9FLAO|nr:T9SS type A sorting domain-containing protein [Flavobacterium agri]NUY82116.1 T9SS type A sorting domain-containing protein [Flavobacterium agri]NYA72140.1 T9SS type A sorting domain-containing protein [Flavobacterium agri]